MARSVQKQNLKRRLSIRLLLMPAETRRLRDAREAFAVSRHSNPCADNGDRSPRFRKCFQKRRPNRSPLRTSNPLPPEMPPSLFPFGKTCFSEKNPRHPGGRPASSPFRDQDGILPGSSRGRYPREAYQVEIERQCLVLGRYFLPQQTPRPNPEK